MRKPKEICRTRFLFPRNGFLIGAGCAFNIAGNYYTPKYSEMNPEGDKRAIENDWRVIGQDFYEAMAKYPPDKISSYKEPHKLKRANYVRRIISTFFKRKQQEEFAARAEFK